MKTYTLKMTSKIYGPTARTFTTKKSALDFLRHCTSTQPGIYTETSIEEASTPTKTAACKQAITETSDLSLFGGNYKWSWFDHRCKAWRESHPTDYARAQEQRRRHLIERATEILHPDREDQHQHESCDLAGGKWQSFVQ